MEGERSSQVKAARETTNLSSTVEELGSRREAEQHVAHEGGEFRILLQGYAVLFRHGQDMACDFATPLGRNPRCILFVIEEGDGQLFFRG